jgi:1,3-beta-glucanosyltransferase GAS1
MTTVMSGAIIYEWTQEVNDYGLITYPDNAIEDNVAVPIGSPIPLQPEFDNLKSVWESVSPSSIAMSAYTPTVSTIACPATTAGWPVNPTAALPPDPTSIVPGAGTTFQFGSAPSTTPASPTASIVVGASTTKTFVPTGGSPSGTAASTITGTAGTASASGSATHGISFLMYELT